MKIAGYTAATLLLLLAITVAVLFAFREQLLAFAIKEVKTKFANRYPATLQIQHASFSGLSTVLLTGITVAPDEGPTLVQADSVLASVSLSKLLVGRVVLTELNITNAKLTPVRDQTGDNFSYLIRKPKALETVTDTLHQARYGEMLNTLIEATFDKIPERARFRNLSVDFLQNGRHIAARMPFLNIRDGKLNSSITYTSDSVATRLRLTGVVDKENQTLAGKIYAADTSGIWVPYIKGRYDARVHFDTLRFSLADKQFAGGVLRLQGEGAIYKLVMNHQRLALHDVVINSAIAKYRISIGPEWVSLDTLSEVKVNNMLLYPQLRYEKERANRSVSVQLVSARTPAQQFFNALPAGLFENLQGLQASGTLTYRFMLHVDTKELDSLQFNSDLEAENFQIIKFGQTDLTKINGPFEHTVYEYGIPARTFVVGPESPYFTPIEHIPGYLKNSILTAEDYGFYRHKGFHEEALRRAIIVNLKEKRFARGGSTLSMQLVKNVFLSRNKTMARKFEEALIVWLIENQRLVSKQRMFEVYLNIIEWGPYVYGVKDAAQFYFNKPPSQLTLAECIYLTRIIPSPKKFKTLFDSYGRLRHWNSGYFKMIGGIMHRRGLISDEDYANLLPQVFLKGRARNMVVTADSIPPDSLLYRDPKTIITPAQREQERKMLELQKKPLPEVIIEEEKPRERKWFWPFGKKKKKKEEVEKL